MHELQRLRLSDGVEIAYADRGRGEPVVLIPGWTMSGEVFRHQLDGALGVGFRIVAIDPRGQGRSTCRIAGNDYPQHGRDLAAIIHALELDGVHLVSWSYGALAVYAYLDQFGDERVRSVTVLDMTPKPLATGDDGDWCEGDVDELMDFMIPALSDPAGFAARFADSMVARELTAAEREWLVAMQLATPRHVATALALSGMQCDFRHVAIAVSGRRPFANVVEESWMPQAQPWLRENTPNAVVWSMPSHLGFWERSAEFNHRFAAFLRYGR